VTGQRDTERRAFLRSIAAASAAALSWSLLSHRATAQPLDKAAPAASDHFETEEIRTDDNTIFIRRYGNGSPLLMIHGFPRTSLMWRDMAPRLASNHTVICVDLRGYGRSGGIIRPLIWRTYPLADVSEAHADLEGGRSHGAIVLTV
jgi:haloacetate dehalogenase